MFFLNEITRNLWKLSFGKHRFQLVNTRKIEVSYETQCKQTKRKIDFILKNQSNEIIGNKQNQFDKSKKKNEICIQKIQ